MWYIWTAAKLYFPNVLNNPKKFVKLGKVLKSTSDLLLSKLSYLIIFKILSFPKNDFFEMSLKFRCYQNSYVKNFIMWTTGIGFVYKCKSNIILKIMKF